ncbi:MAG: glycosyltransferase [bacterium]
MNFKNPKITVLMPVYNGEKYLREAVESILNQTFTDFEFLIINDGSNDKSVEIIESYKDKRILLAHNEANLGLIATLNKGLDLAQGEYIARMDCDDISLPKRLEKQLKFMDNHQEVGVCGAWIEMFDEKGSLDINKYSTDHDLIKCKLFFLCTIAHPSVMLRKSFFQKHKLYYSDNYKHAEDFELWQRCGFYFQLRNIPEVLVKYRINSFGICKKHIEQQRNTLKLIDNKNLNLMGIETNEEILEFHQIICPLRPPPIPTDKEFVIKADKWLQKIQNANIQTKLYPGKVFSKVLGERWFAVCNKNAEKFGFWIWKIFWQSPLSKSAKLSVKAKIKFALKCLKSKFFTNPSFFKKNPKVF